jgi:hypothetical protein
VTAACCTASSTVASMAGAGLRLLSVSPPTVSQVSSSPWSTGRTTEYPATTQDSTVSIHYLKTSNRSHNICNRPLTLVTSTHICNGCCLAPVTYRHARTTPGLASTTPVTNVDF